MANQTIITILRRLIDSQGSLSKGAAEAVLQIRFAPDDQQRISQLAEKSNSGSLLPEEAAEYDALICAADLLSLWKSKARICLAKPSSAAERDRRDHTVAFPGFPASLDRTFPLS